jgi:hypothetical protein
MSLSTTSKPDLALSFALRLPKNDISFSRVV